MGKYSTKRETLWVRAVNHSPESRSKIDVIHALIAIFKGVQYPDPEFDRRWEKKRRDAEDAKQKEIEERRR